jgi:hypothetical protein
MLLRDQPPDHNRPVDPRNRDHAVLSVLTRHDGLFFIPLTDESVQAVETLQYRCDREEAS